MKDNQEVMKRVEELAWSLILERLAMYGMKGNARFTKGICPMTEDTKC